MNILEEVSMNHTNFIRTCLNMGANGSEDEKATHATILYNYLTNEALDFVLENQTSKRIVVQKAYELKTQSSDFPKLENSLNCFLIASGLPLEQTEEYLRTFYLENGIPFDDIDDILLIKRIATDLEFSRAISNPERYLEYFKENYWTDENIDYTAEIKERYIREEFS